MAPRSGAADVLTEFYPCGPLLNLPNVVYAASALSLSRYDIAATHNPLWAELCVSDSSPGEGEGPALRCVTAIRPQLAED